MFAPLQPRRSCRIWSFLGCKVVEDQNGTSQIVFTARTSKARGDILVREAAPHSDSRVEQHARVSHQTEVWGPLSKRRPDCDPPSLNRDPPLEATPPHLMDEMGDRRRNLRISNELPAGDSPLSLLSSSKLLHERLDNLSDDDDEVIPDLFHPYVPT